MCIRRPGCSARSGIEGVAGYFTLVNDLKQFLWSGALLEGSARSGGPVFLYSLLLFRVGVHCSCQIPHLQVSTSISVVYLYKCNVLIPSERLGHLIFEYILRQVRFEWEQVQSTKPSRSPPRPSPQIFLVGVVV